MLSHGGLLAQTAGVFAPWTPVTLIASSVRSDHLGLTGLPSLLPVPSGGNACKRNSSGSAKKDCQEI